MVKKQLSKSSMNLYMQCPYKWKRCYIDGEKSEPSPAQERGIRIHEKIEKFYKRMKPDEELKPFIEFEFNRLKQLTKLNKFDKKYFYPLFQELKVQSEKLGLKGFIDAVYINPQDDELIIIDFKTGKYYPDKFDDYRFELAVYTELLRESGKVDKKPKYWGIIFVDQNKLFFEKIDEEYIRRMYSKADTIRENIENKKFNKNQTFWCKYCQFKEECFKNGR